MCTYFFEGKGYSDEFNHHMAATIEYLQGNPVVRIVNYGDEICSCCPNLQGGVCKDKEKVLAYDNKVLDLCGLESGAEMPWLEFARLVQKNIIQKQRLVTVCSKCEWWEICHKKSLKKRPL